MNTQEHTCSKKPSSEQIRPSSVKWIAATVLPWVDEKPEVGATELREKLEKKFGVQFPHHKVFDGKEIALDMIQGNWNDNFTMLYSFKVEVEKTSRRSVVDID